MAITRRRLVQTTALLPVVSAIPSVSKAQDLLVGVNANIVASNTFVGPPQNIYASLGLEYFYTNFASGVAIDIVPQPAAGGHAGICFHASPNSFGQWQAIQSANQSAPQQLWYRGVGVIFQSDQRIQSEQWIIGPDGRPAANVRDLGAKFPLNTILRVTSQTSYFGDTTISVNILNSSGAIVAQLVQFSLRAEVKSDRAGVFVAGGGNIQVQPYALYS